MQELLVLDALLKYWHNIEKYQQGMDMDLYAVLWNAGLTIGVGFMTFMVNRVANTLDNLQKTDSDISKEVHKLKADTMTRIEVDRLMERMESRIESYHSMHVETSKVIFAKLDLIVDKVADKVSRDDCNNRMGDRRALRD
jgi:hypothetical protein